MKEYMRYLMHNLYYKNQKDNEKGSGYEQI